jgi:hypothetical protein
VAHSPLLQQYRIHLKSLDDQISALRKAILEREQNRDWEIGELTRFRNIVAERLADPERLRPELTFDDYVTKLSRHVVAFILLAITTGMVLNAVITPSGIRGVYRLMFG